MKMPDRAKRPHLAGLLAALLLQGGLIAPVSAQTIGLVMPVIDDVFRDTIAAGITTATQAAGLTLTQTDAQGDEGLQVSNARKQIEEGASALIVLGLNGTAETRITEIARDAKVPLVFVNHEPDHKLLGDGVAYVGSEEKVAGTLQAQETCRLLKGKGSVVVLLGELNHIAARTRTRYVHEVFATPECQGIEILEQQGGNWDRGEAKALMQSFLDVGLKPDGVVANNDEMALGAIDALKPAGLKPVVTGIDATNDGLEAMKAGDLSATVLQDGNAQGAVAVDVARKMLAGETVETLNWIPFVLVRKDDVPALLAKRAIN